MAAPRPPRAAAALVRLLLPEPLAPVILGDLEEEYLERRSETGRLSADAWYWGQLLTLRPLRLRRALRPVARRWYANPWSFVRSLGDRPLEALTSSLRHTFRRLGRAPAFTGAAVLSLALGIGGNTAVFSLTNAIFLRDRGIVEPERVIQVYRQGGTPYWRVTWEDYRRMRDDLDHLFSDVTAYHEDGVRVGDSDDVVPALRVSGDYFGVMGVQPALGRGFTPGRETDVEHETGVVVLSWSFWQNRFGGDPEILGREVRVNAQPTTVIGILPRGFEAKATGIAMDVFLPDPQYVRAPNYDNLWAGARLAPDVSVDQARAGLARVAEDYNQGRPESARPVAFTVVTEADVDVQPGFDQTIASMAALLFAVVGVVLLIACVNLASFLLARATDRKQEFAVRKALGAGRSRIVGELLGESLVLGVLGGAAGLAVAYVGLELLLGVQPPFPVNIRLDVSPDWRVLSFTLTVSMLAGVLFGIFPALQASRAQVAATLRDESTGSTGSRRTWTVRSALVVGQVTLSLVLLVAAGLFLRSLQRATNVDPGFEPEGVAITTVDPETTGYSEEEAIGLYNRLLENARALPEVQWTALGTRIPLQLGNRTIGVRRPGVPLPPGREWHYVQIVQATPGYFQALGIELLRGRRFDDGDTDDAPPVVILNRAAADALWGADAEVVGEPLELSWRDGEEGRVVGVVRNAKLKTLGEAAQGILYVPLSQRFDGSPILIAKGSGSASALAGRLRQAAKELDPDLYVHSAMTARDSMGTALFLPRMAGILLGVFGGLALVMSVVGLYGIVSYTVASREREIGIRRSLGARSKDVMRLMMGKGLKLVALGVALGTVLGAFAGGFLERFLFGITGHDPVTLVSVPLLLLAVATLAAWVPARRASRVNPVSTLRSQ